MYRYGDGEVSAVDAQLFVGREGKTSVFARGIFDFSKDDVGGQVHLQGGGDEELRLGGVGVDVIAGRDTKIQVHHGRLGTLRRDQWDGCHLKGGGFRSEE